MLGSHMDDDEEYQYLVRTYPSVVKRGIVIVKESSLCGKGYAYVQIRSRKSHSQTIGVVLFWRKSWIIFRTRLLHMPRPYGKCTGWISSSTSEQIPAPWFTSAVHGIMLQLMHTKRA
ncbi:hypothetical protein AG1IA_06356 [Rhizoctonia solani AG-1 IA]|uniref:Uncharacterized protein n=1 Tax=Thanatephorus cucumeris (strain AG1-IA) TaxID=983506 RepID=L8WN77_THACA|nr:hypothetical protein AG1IA_06356 [Rhizoctonia solani AG-1 IA]